MNIAIIGNDVALNEVKTRLGNDHVYTQTPSVIGDVINRKPSVVFDFNSEWDNQDLSLYQTIGVPLFFNSVFSTLYESDIKSKGPVFGFCGLPTFFNRPRVELVCREADKLALKNIMTTLNLDYTLVKDQVGMVTPRVICMIINEAYEALQQGVASREDIDLSMKLGTNYPFGPFEWGDKIGLESLRKLMRTLKHATNDSRFNPNF